MAQLVLSAMGPIGLFSLRSNPTDPTRRHHPPRSRSRTNPLPTHQLSSDCTLGREKRSPCMLCSRALFSRHGRLDIAPSGKGLKEMEQGLRERVMGVGAHSYQLGAPNEESGLRPVRTTKIYLFWAHPAAYLSCGLTWPCAGHCWYTTASAQASRHCACSPVAHRPVPRYTSRVGSLLAQTDLHPRVKWPKAEGSTT